MFCLKCGRETAAEQVFCEGCLQTMQQYPVKPGTAVHLPHRDEAKKPTVRKRGLSLEEQLRQLKRLNKRLRVVAALLTVVLCIATVMLVHTLLNGETAPLIGKNYTIDTSQAP